MVLRILSPLKSSSAEIPAPSLWPFYARNSEHDDPRVTDDGRAEAGGSTPPRKPRSEGLAGRTYRDVQLNPTESMVMRGAHNYAWKAATYPPLREEAPWTAPRPSCRPPNGGTCWTLWGWTKSPTPALGGLHTHHRRKRRGHLQIPSSRTKNRHQTRIVASPWS